MEVNSIRIVNNLAEITSHHDRHILEKSLLKTLGELFSIQVGRLFRVRELEKNHELTLLAYCADGSTVTSQEAPRLSSTESELTDALLLMAIEKGEVEMVANPEESGWFIVYPVFNSHGDISAALLLSSEQQPSANDQRLVYSILKVYSNHLSLIEKSQKDKLTGLFNREMLDTEITETLVRQHVNLTGPIQFPEERRQKNANKNWLGLIDIDHFKSINDNYGHLYGDEVIILVARLMASNCVREDDLVFRYGGEEFVVLLKAPTEEHARQAFERIRKTVAEYAFPQLKQVTVSIGFVEIRKQQSPQDAIGEADDALYYAKDNGRNQVQSHLTLKAQDKIKTIVKHFGGDVELF